MRSSITGEAMKHKLTTVHWRRWDRAPKATEREERERRRGWRRKLERK